MGNFSLNTKNRAWVATIQIKNMIKSGLTEEEYMNPEILANFFLNRWSNSGKSRVGGIAVCRSANGLYHAHMALYGSSSTTLKNVIKIMYEAHVEPQLGGKEALSDYLTKQGKYAEKGEDVLYTTGLENIQNTQGQRSDLYDIAELLEDGLTPSQIMEENFAYRKYERMIKSAYIDKRIKETPLKKEMYNEWHCGESGSGKSHTYFTLCEQYEPENVYITSDFENGGLDFYIDQGAPDILFLDEFKGNIPFSRLLAILDEHSRNQTHCRYANTYNLWTKCYITSIFPPEEAYKFMVEDTARNTDKLAQLLRRLNLIVYHYKTPNGEYKTYSIPGTEYTNYADLKYRALADKDGFVPLESNTVTICEEQEEIEFLLPPK